MKLFAKDVGDCCFYKTGPLIALADHGDAGLTYFQRSTDVSQGTSTHAKFVFDAFMVCERSVHQGPWAMCRMVVFHMCCPLVLLTRLSTTTPIILPGTVVVCALTDEDSFAAIALGE